MKRMLFLPALMLYMLTSCQNAPKADDAEATDAQKTASLEGKLYDLDETATTMEWIGTKPTGNHHGTIKIKDGVVALSDDAIHSGKFTIDVNTLQPDDQDEKGNTKLRNHLLSADFFEAEQYPEAFFEITNVSAGTQIPDNELVMKDATHTITGNLTLKGTTKSISFPAKMQATENNLIADANFNINRTDWNLNYGSDKNLGDKFIAHEINLQLHLVANK